MVVGTVIVTGVVTVGRLIHTSDDNRTPTKPSGAVAAFPCSCNFPPDREQFDEGCFLFELAFNFGNELFTAAVDVVLGVKQRTPSSIALSLNGFDAFLGLELFLKGQRGSCGAVRFPDLPVEFLNFTLQT